MGLSPNEQTPADLQEARNQSSVNVDAVRNYLYGKLVVIQSVA